MAHKIDPITYAERLQKRARPDRCFGVEVTCAHQAALLSQVRPRLQLCYHKRR